MTIPNLAISETDPRVKTFLWQRYALNPCITHNAFGFLAFCFSESVSGYSLGPVQWCSGITPGSIARWNRWESTGYYIWNWVLKQDRLHYKVSTFSTALSSYGTSIESTLCSYPWASFCPTLQEAHLLKNSDFMPIKPNGKGHSSAMFKGPSRFFPGDVTTY